MLDTLLCHVSTSQGSYHSSISFLYLFVSIPICCCSSKMRRLWGKWLKCVCFSFMRPVMKSGFTEAKGRGNSRPGGPNIPTPAVLSRCTGSMWQHPRQEVWARSQETFKLIMKEEPKSSCSVTSWPGLVTVIFTSILRIVNIDFKTKIRWSQSFVK